MIRPLFVRAALCALLCAFAASCGSDPEASEAPELSVSVRSVSLAGAADAEASFSVTAGAPWSLAVEGGGFGVSAAGGKAGTATVTVRSAAANDERTRRDLGRIVVRLNSGARSAEVAVSQRPAEASHAFFFFFIGTSLQSFFDANLRHALESMNAAVPGDGRVAAFCRRNGTWQIVELAYDPATNEAAMIPLREVADPDRSSPEFLTRTLAEMMELIPAAGYGVAFGGHGTGWLPAGYSVYGPAIGFDTFGRRTPAADDPWPVTRYFGEKGSLFDIGDISNALAATGVRFDYLIFDDCFMSNIETLYTLRRNARYIVASPCEIMGDGFPYRYVIPALFGGERPLNERLHEVCERFYRYYLSEYDPSFPSGCVALTDCDRLEALAEAARPLFATASAACDPERLQSYEGLPRHLFYDFLQYAEQVAADSRALDAFRARFDEAFPPDSRFHTPSFYSYYSRPDMRPIDFYSGVTCSAPSELYPAENGATEWWQAVR